MDSQSVRLLGCWRAPLASSTSRNEYAFLSIRRKAVPFGVTARLRKDLEKRQPNVMVTSVQSLRSFWDRLPVGSTKARSIVMLNVIAMAYASSIPVVKEVEGAADPAVFTVVRFGLTAAAFLPFVMRTEWESETRRAGVELGVWASAGYVMQAVGLLTSGAGRASFLSMLTVIVVPLLEGLLGGAVPALTWVGALVCLLGVALLESSGSPPCVGDLLNVMSAVFFGVHMLRTQHIARSTKRHKFLALMGYQMCVVAVLSTVWYVVEIWCLHQQQLQEVEWEMVWEWVGGFPWMAAVYTGIFTTGLCTWGEMSAMRCVSATDAAIIYAMEPVWGGAFAWLMLGETWDAPACLGAALVLAGSLTVQIFGQHNHDATADQIALSASPIVVSSKNDNTPSS